MAICYNVLCTLIMLTTELGIMRFNLKWPVVNRCFCHLCFTYAVNYWRQQRLVKEPLKEALLKIER